MEFLQDFLHPWRRRQDCLQGVKIECKYIRMLVGMQVQIAATGLAIGFVAAPQIKFDNEGSGKASLGTEETMP